MKIRHILAPMILATALIAPNAAQAAAVPRTGMFWTSMKYQCAYTAIGNNKHYCKWYGYKVQFKNTGPVAQTALVGIYVSVPAENGKIVSINHRTVLNGRFVGKQQTWTAPVQKNLYVATIPVSGPKVSNRDRDKVIVTINVNAAISEKTAADTTEITIGKTAL